MGRFRIIETAIDPTVCISRHIDRHRPLLRSRPGLMSIVLAAFAAYFGPTVTGGASARAGPPLRPLQTLETRQYHGLEARQYHRGGRSSAPALASLSRSRELAKSISARVISPYFTSHSPNASPKTMIRTSFALGDRIGARNDRPIGHQIGAENGRGPRVMLDIAAALGLVYLAFLAVWFWATRFRVRPPSSAPS